MTGAKSWSDLLIIVHVNQYNSLKVLYCELTISLWNQSQECQIIYLWRTLILYATMNYSQSALCTCVKTTRHEKLIISSLIVVSLNRCQNMTCRGLEDNQSANNSDILAILNSLWPSDAIWWHKPMPILAQVMACCLMALSKYLNPCWLFISEVLRHSHQSNFLHFQTSIWCNEFENCTLKIVPNLRGQWVNKDDCKGLIYQ